MTERYTGSLRAGKRGYTARFTCEGPKSGPCGKGHRDLQGAFKCCERPRAGDRVPVLTSGEPLRGLEALAVQAWKESPP